MFIIQQLLILLFASLIKTNFVQNLPARTTTRKTSPVSILNNITRSSFKNIANANSSIRQTSIDKTSTVLPEDVAISIDTIDYEIKNEVFVNDLLETAEETDVIDKSESYTGPHYELDWNFIDKDTIRVTFDLFSIPTSLIEHSRNSEINRRKSNILSTMTTMPSRTLKSITLLKYFHFIIRPYNKNLEIILKLEKLSIKNLTLKKYNHFSNSLRLTALNHNEKYSICICYYQTNESIKTPDLLLCQDIINDYTKFSHLRTDPKHGLVFIITQYSIILALLFVLQSVFTMRKRRVAEIISQMVTNKANSIRTTLSSVSLVRQSFSSLDTAAEQQQHARNGHAMHHEPKIDEETRLKKRIISSPAIVISQPSVSFDHGATSSDEIEPFLKRIPSKNHVHFLLGQGEGSDEEDENETTDVHTGLNPNMASGQREPYDDQADALLSMAHILDTNKPWSKHSDHTSPV